MDDKQPHKQGPLVSVVMCAYNGLPYIQEAVGSILNQTYKNWELIICDDGSKDGTREWLRSLEQDARIRLFFHDRNMGYVANKNFGHQQARGTYITQLDNDDTCPPERLEKQIDAVQQHPEIRIVGSAYARIDAAGEMIGRHSIGKDMLITARTEEDYPFWYPSLLVHRTVFEQVGYFDPYFDGALGDDIYWTTRANEQFPIWYCHEMLYHYRYIATSITNVLNNERKLIIWPVLAELFRQRRETGTDWLEQGNKGALADFESGILGNGKYMSEQYRVWAAKAIDRKHKRQAASLMRKAIKTYPWSGANIATLLYYIRRFGY